MRHCVNPSLRGALFSAEAISYRPIETASHTTLAVTASNIQPLTSNREHHCILRRQLISPILSVPDLGVG